MMFIAACMVTLLCMAIGVPVFLAFIAGAAVALQLFDQDHLMPIIFTRFVGGLDLFPLLAVPLFLFVGEVMSEAKITNRLIGLANAIFGHLPGGLGHANVGSSMLFAGISGSAVADTASIGKFMIPAMVENGYPKNYSIGITAASSIIGPIIPPSIIMVIYATVMNVSVSKLFAAAIVPGLLLGLSLMIFNYFVSKKHRFPRTFDRFNLKRLVSEFLFATPSLGAPILIVGGILSGIFTATEAAAIAALYVCFLGLAMNSITIGGIARSLGRASLMSATVLIVVAAASGFSFLASISGVGEQIRNLVTGLDNPILFFLALNCALLLTGMILDAVPAIIIVGTVMAPAAALLGIDEIHLAVVMSINLSIGLITPPMGVVLFVAAKVGMATVPEVSRAVVPFLVPLLAVLLMVSLFPSISLVLPSALGL
jgi:tripartite ATP-independent transporter DctM subunit